MLIPNRLFLNPVERKIIIALGDILIIYSSLNLLYQEALDQKMDGFWSPFLYFSLGIGTFLVLAYILDFYNLDRDLKVRSLVSHTTYVAGIYVMLVILSLIFIYDASFWRKPLMIFFFVTPVSIFLWRLFFRNLFALIPNIKKVLYIYDDTTEAYVKESCAKINGRDLKTYYKVKLTVSLDKHQLEGKNRFISSLDNVDAFILNIKDYNKLTGDLERVLLSNILIGKEVLSYTSFYENTYEALPIKSHNDSFYEILQLQNRRIRYFQTLFSYVINFFFALCLGVLFLAVIPLVALGNLFFNRGPLFYAQKRVGKHGKEFMVYKFRSMVVDAEKAGAQMATANDSRITPFGRILRKTRVDELPQIISVLKGEMSLIGPRPERKVFTEELEKMIPYYRVRHLIKPGITGWAQVKYKYGETLDDSITKLEYDLYYIKNMSVSLDLKILFKTITTILFSRGQ